MTIRLRCPHCSTAASVSDDADGKSLRCKSCRQTFTCSRADNSDSGTKLAKKSTTEAKSTLAMRSESGRTLVDDATALVDEIGGYSLHRLLGEGAFGQVHLGYDHKLDRWVALKVPHPHTLGSEKAKRRFAREAKSAARLRHPNIVPIYAAGFDGRVHYIASQFIAGPNDDADDQPSAQTLEDVIKAKKKPPRRQMAKMVRDLAKALSYAHSQGIIHRDVKPANVLVDAKGNVHLSDFGLAHQQDAIEKITHDGAVLGTPAYMAPELAKGMGGKIDPACDQYSLGMILYEMLCGEVPFQGPVPLVLSMQVNQEPPPPCSVNRKIPKDLETICMTALSKKVEDRYENCEEMAEDLQSWLDDEPISVRPLNPYEKLVRWCRRSPATATLTLIVLLLLIVGSTVSATYALRASAQARIASEKANELEDERARTEQKADEALASSKFATEKEAEARRLLKLANDNEASAKANERLAQENAVKADAQAQLAKEKAADALKAKRFADQQLYLSDMRLAQDDWEHNNFTRLRRKLKYHVPQSAEDPDHRNFEWYYFQKLAHLDLRTFRGHDGYVMTVAFRSNGTRLVTASFDRTMKIWNVETGQALQTFPIEPGYFSAFTFSPDGNRLALPIRNNVKVWDVETGNVVRELKGPTEIVTCLAFSSDSKFLAGGSRDGKVALWEIHTGRRLGTLDTQTKSVGGLAFHPDGKRLAVAVGGSLQLWDLRNGGKKLNDFDVSRKGGGRALAFSPDGKWLVNGGYKNLTVWDVENAKLFRYSAAHYSTIGRVVFSPNGKSFATASYDRTVKLWDLETGRLLETYKGHSDAVYGAAFGPDGRYLASASRNKVVKLWALPPEVERPFDAYRAMVRSVAFHTDGRRLVSGSNDKTVKLWDVQTGQLLHTFEGHESPVEDVALSPDGSYVVSCSSREGMILLWDVKTGQVLHRLKDEAPYVHSVAFSPDGKRFVSGTSEGLVKYWDVRTGQLLDVLKEHTSAVRGVAFSSMGKHVASASLDQTVKLWDEQTGKSLHTFDVDAAVYCVQFSPDGKLLAAGASDQIVRLWDVETGKLVRTFEGHLSAILSMSFSPDGTRLASASGDRTVKLWNVQTGQELLTFRQDLSRSVHKIAFGSDKGHLRLAAGRSNGIEVWEAPKK